VKHSHGHEAVSHGAGSEVHSHSHARRGGASSRLLVALGLAASYMLAEVVGGYLTNSLALLADAGHMLSDVAALAISLAAMQAARRAPSPSRTYGYHRAEVLGALVNAMALVAVAGGILLEAVRRFSDPPHVDAPIALAVAAGGLGINLVSLYVLGGHGHGDAGVGVRAAWLHVLADALGSVGAITSALLIWTAGWQLADPAASVVIALLVVYSALTLLFEVLNVLMEGSPRHIDVSDVRASIAALPSVQDVHDLHVWTITSGMDSLSGHVRIDPEARPQQVLADVRRLLHDRFGIVHVTIQIEDVEIEEHHVCP